MAKKDKPPKQELGKLKKKPTIKDVAEHAGVSFKTVSRVINMNSNVAEDKRQKVLNSIEALNYTIDMSARNLRGNKSFILGLIYDVQNAFYVLNVQHGVLEACAQGRYDLQLHPYQYESETVCEDILKLVETSRLAGLILTPPFSEMPDLVKALHSKGVHFVRIMSKANDEDNLSPLVHIDDEHVSETITEYLIGLGHRKIGYLLGQESHNSSKKRYLGYIATLEKHGIKVKPDYIMKGNFTFMSGLERAKVMLSLPDRPTAIEAGNDEIAAGVIAAASLLGIKVPDDLSITGIENSPLSQQTWPRITSMIAPAQDMARCAASLLIDDLRIPPEEEREYKRIMFDLEFVVKDSTAAPKTRNWNGLIRKKTSI